MTERLYYDDSYLRTFTARVVAQTIHNDQPAARLDRTAFYPEGGGQPCDTGTLGGVEVREVCTEADGGVWHILSEPLAQESVTGEVDWPRRFDHMQQHTGQHILSRAFIETGNAETVGFHLGVSCATIDLDTAAITPGDLTRAEDAANAIVAENRSIHTRFVAPEEAARLPLRRAPTVEGEVRVVEVEDYDWSACGGTHVATAAEVGLIKVTRMEKRGAETRVTFLCGQRALTDYQRKHRLVQQLAQRLTTGEEDILAAVERLEAEASASYKALRAAEASLVTYEAATLYAEAAPEQEWRVVQRVYRDTTPERVKAIALQLQSQPNCIALLAWVGPEGRAQLTFAATPGAPTDVGTLLRESLAPLGGRGGGKADYAQGGLLDGSQAESALAAARARLDLSGTA